LGLYSRHPFNWVQTYSNNPLFQEIKSSKTKSRHFCQGFRQTKALGSMLQNQNFRGSKFSADPLSLSVKEPECA